MKRVTWCALATGSSVLLWFGAVDGIKGAMNAGLFMVWTVSILSLAYLTPNAQEQLANNKNYPSIPGWLDTSVDLVQAVFLAWHGWFITASALVVSMILAAGMRDKVMRVRAAK